MSAFVKLGAARTKTTAQFQAAGSFGSDSNTDTSVLAGIGATFAINQQVSVVAEYEQFGKVIKDEGDSLKADLLSVGVRVNL